MSHRMLVFVITSALLGVSTVATAGRYYGQPAVIVDYGTFYTGGGALRETRDTNDTNSNIGCQVWAMSGMQHGFCWAMNPQGASVSCYTDREDFIRLFAGINESSAVWFYGDANGYCTDLSIDNFSHNLPAN